MGGGGHGSKQKPKEKGNEAQDVSLEFRGGITRRGKLVLGGIVAAVSYFGTGMSWWGSGLIFSTFMVWAFGSRDVQRDHDAFHAATRRGGWAPQEEDGFVQRFMDEVHSDELIGKGKHKGE